MPKREQQELTEEATSRISSSIRSLLDDQVDRGFDLSRPMRCDSCDLEKPSGGASKYSTYQLCNDCLLDFALRLASGRVENVGEYMTRQPDGAEPPPPLTGTRERAALPKPGLAAREKFMPSNEPA